MSPTVWYLGFTSLLTDISSEMVNGILPLYLVGFLRLSPLQFGVIDGLYQGVSAVLRLGGGVIADRWRRYKETAAAGYALSAICKLGLLVTGASWTALAAVIALDRTGKGLRTAPRDALITLRSDKTSLATSFGVHRALDAAGALLGPVVAFVILANAPNAFDVVFVVSFCVAVMGLGVLMIFVDASQGLPSHTNWANDQTKARGARPAGSSVEAHAERGSADQPSGAVQAAEDPGLIRSNDLNYRSNTIIGLFGVSFGHLVLAASVLSLTTMSDAFIYLALQQRLAFAPGVFPLLYVATSLVYMAAAVPAGRLADRFGRRPVFLAGYLLLGTVYGMLLIPASESIGAVAAIVGLGAYYAATDGVLMAIAGRLLPPAICATGLALLTTCTSLARLASSIAFGWIWTAGDVHGAVRVFGVALGVALVVAVLALRRVEMHAVTDSSR